MRFRSVPPALVAATALLAGACAAPTVTPTQAADRPWGEVLAEAEGQTVDLWMWGGDERGNAYVDEVLAPALWERLDALAPSLWREGRTYPRDQVALDRLFADGQVDFTMTYGPATLTELVADGTFPATTRVLTVEDGTVGNASFLGVPASSPDSAGAMVVADLALSPEQQVAKADPEVWGQFTVLDTGLLDRADAAAFDALPQSPVVPPYDELAANALPELSSAWVKPLDEGWRREVLGSR